MYRLIPNVCAHCEVAASSGRSNNYSCKGGSQEMDYKERQSPRKEEDREDGWIDKLRTLTQDAYYDAVN